MKRKKLWENVGGGMLVKGSSKYPGDVMFENATRKSTAIFKCTREAYIAGFPNRVRDLYDIKRRKGVKLVKLTEN